MILDQEKAVPNTERQAARDNRTSTSRSIQTGRERESAQMPASGSSNWSAELKQDGNGGEKLKFQPPAHYPPTYTSSKIQQHAPQVPFLFLCITY